MTEAKYDELVQKLTEFNVSLKNVNGEYRSTYDIMADIASKWDTMSSMQQSALATALSGTRQQAVFYSIIGQFKEATGAMEQMSNSAGELKESYSIYMDSAQAKINQFKASFQEFSTNVFSSSFVKNLVDIGSLLLNGANQLAKCGTLFPMIISGITTIRSFKILRSLDGVKASVDAISSSMLNEKTSTDALIQSTANLSLQEKQAVVEATMRKAAGNEKATALANERLQVVGLTSAEQQMAVANTEVGTSAQGATVGIKAMWSAMSAGEKASVIMSLLSSIMTLWNAISSIWEDEEPAEVQKRSIAEVESELKQLSDTASNAAKDFKSLKESSDKIIPRFVQLSEGVDAFGKNVSLSDEQYSEYLSLCNELAEMFPSINLGMDSNGNAMLNLAGDAETLTEKLNNLVESERDLANAKIASGIPQALEDIVELNKETDELINNKTELEKRNEDRYNQAKNKSLPEEMTISAYDDPDDLTNKASNLIRDMYEKYGIKGKKIGFSGEKDGQAVLGYKFEWDYEDFDEKRAEQVYKQGLSTNEKLINDYNKRIEAKWKTINPMLSAWMETDSVYNELSSKMQDVAKAMVAGVDFKELGITTEAGMKKYINESIISPLYNSSDEAKDAFDSITNWQEQLKKGEITSEEFSSKTKSAFDKLKGSMSPESIDAFVKGFKSAGFEGETFDDIVNNIAESWAKVDSTATTTLTDLSDSLSNLKTKYDIIAQAQADMFDGGITADTIKAIRDAIGDDKSVSYLDFLYEENGMIKLNIEAWKEYSNIEINGNKDSIEKTISDLKTERGEIQARIDELNKAKVHDKNWQEQLDSENDKLRENTSELEANQNKLSMYETLYANAAKGLDEYSTALDNFKNVSSAINQISDSLTTVADLQERVKEGFTLSLEEALKFADVYPEILNSASVSADGQIQLNSDIVNTFIRGKEAELRAEVQSKIDKLEAEKEVVTAKKNFAEAQLKIAQSVGEGETKMSAEAAVYRLEVNNKLVEKLVGNGLSEAEAHKKACEAMDKNYISFNNVVGDVAYDIARNMGVSAESLATNMANALTNVKENFEAKGAESVNVFTKQFRESGLLDTFNKIAPDSQAARFFKGMGVTVEQKKTPGGFTSLTPTIIKTTDKYKNVDYSKSSANIELQKFVEELKLDIDKYSKSLSQYDGQIAALKALLKTTLEKFSTKYKESQKEKTKTDKDKGKTSSDKKEVDNWFIKEYNKRNHLINMEKQDVSDYLDWLKDAYKKAYKEGLISLDDYYKYTEEIFNKRRELFNDHLNDVEHEISMRSEYEGDSKTIHKLYTGLINDVIKKIREARKQGLTDDDDYIQGLQDKYQSYVKARKELDNQIKDNAKDSIENLVEIRQKMLKQEIEDEKDAISKKLSALKKFYDDQKKMLKDEADEEKYLEDQKNKRKAVADIEKKLKSLELDNSAWAQKRKLELSQELADKQKELNDFEKDHARTLAEDELDKAYEKQEEALNKQTEKLDAQLNSAKEMYDRALADIKNGSTALYEDMIKWNNQYGDGIQKTITTAWEDAYKALEEYKDLYGKFYKGIILDNATNYTPSEDNWDTSPVSGTKTIGSITQLLGLKPLTGYAAGTQNAIKGLHRIDESGSETVFQSKDGNKYMMFSGGEMVLDAESSNFLYKFATKGREIFNNIIGAVSKGISNISSKTSNPEINMGDIIINGNADKATISEIRRAQRESVDMLLKEFNKLNK